jgi:predicted aspartyl protease
VRKAVISALVGLTIGGGFLPAHAEDAPACRLKLYSSLPMITNPDGRMSVPVTVQDRNYSFLVDTGGAVATIGWDQAEEVGLKKKEAGTYLTGVGGRYLDSYIVTDRFSLGKLTGSGLAVYVEPKSDTDFDGTIAPDMMKHYDVDLDFAHGKMNLFSPDHCPGKVVYWNQGNAVVISMQVSRDAHIRIPVSLDGKVIMAILDTGAVNSIMSVRAASFLGITESNPQMKLKESYGYRKQTRLYTYPFKALDMGGIVVSNPHITIGSNDYMGAFDTDMILGMATLRQLHLYIAYGEGKLYLTPATAN